MRGYLFFMLITLLTAGVGCENGDKTDPALIGELDREFLLATSDDALFQINAGQVAAAGTTQERIQEYGEDMTTDNTQAKKELQQLAAARKVELPTTLSDERQQQLDSLSMLNGAALDTLYINQMVAVQERIVHMMEIEGTSGKDAELKQWATERLPIVRQFGERAKAIASWRL